MFGKAKSFQKQVVQKWNPTVDDPTLSVYLGLLDINETASKECGSIVLDLLLRSGVLVELEDGSWDLAEDWESRRVY